LSWREIALASDDRTAGPIDGAGGFGAAPVFWAAGLPLRKSSPIRLPPAVRGGRAAGWAPADAGRAAGCAREG
jgi:hypothetical protein